MRRARAARGHAVFEYLVALAAVVVLFIVPLDGPGGQCASLAVCLVDSLRAAYQSLTHFISLP
jgi:hypothetical protein